MRKFNRRDSFYYNYTNKTSFGNVPSFLPPPPKPKPKPKPKKQMIINLIIKKNGSSYFYIKF